MFEGQTNVGDAPLGGTVAFDAGEAVYRITGSGEDIYGESDAFYYVWREAVGDVVLTADVAFEGTGGHPYRKAGWKKSNIWWNRPWKISRKHSKRFPRIFRDRQVGRILLHSCRNPLRMIIPK